MRAISSTIVTLVALLALCSGCSDDNGSEPTPPAPQIQQVLLNDGYGYAVTRLVTVSVSCENDVSIESIRLAETSDLSGTAWQAYEDGMTFQLSSGDELKTVYAQVKSDSGALSEIASCQIFLAATTTVVGASPRNQPDEDDPSVPIELELWIANATNLYSAVFKLEFDSTDVTVTGVEVDFDGQLLRSGGASLVVSNASYDNEEGTILIGALPQQSGFQGVSGSGPFARISLTLEETAQAGATLQFAPGEWCALYGLEGGGPPELIEDVIFIDCTLAP